MKNVFRCLSLFAVLVVPALAQQPTSASVNLLRVKATDNLAKSASATPQGFLPATIIVPETTLWVDPAGNDSTAEIGRIDKPFASPETASTAAPAGSTIILNPGGYVIYSNSVIVPPQGRLIGYGATITNWLAPTWRPAFRLTDDCLVEGVEVIMARNGSNVFQVAVGTGVQPGIPTSGPTNFVIRNVSCFNGDTDVFFFFGTNTWGSLYNVRARSRWDTLAYNNIKNLKVYDSIFEAIGPNSIVGNQTFSHSIAAGTFFQNTRAEFHNCVFKARSDDSYNVYSTGAAGNAPYTNFFFFYNCTFTNEGARTLATNVYQDTYSSSELTFSGCDVAPSNLPANVTVTFLSVTNLVQTMNLELTFYARGTTATNGTTIVTPIVKRKKTTRDIIELLGNATTNDFSPNAKLVLITPMPNGNSSIQIRDGNSRVDVSDFFSYRQFSDDVEGSQTNALLGVEKETDYSLIELSLRNHGTHLLELQFNVSGFSTEKTSSTVRSGSILGKSRRAVATLAGSGTFRDRSGDYSSILQASFRITGDALETEPPDF